MRAKGRGKPAASAAAAASSSRKRGSRGSDSHSPPHRGGGRSTADASSDLFPVDITPFDDERLCPRFRNLISRDPDVDPATAEDLDAIQAELEQLLLHNMDRQHALCGELAFLTTGERPSTSAAGDASRRTPLAQAPVFEMRTPIPAKVKTEKGNEATPSTGRKLGRPKEVDRIENIAVPSTDKIGRRRVFFWPQNRMPEKFWEFVDEFVPALGADDLAQLSQMLKEMSEDRLGKYLRMPGAASKHYSLRNGDGGDCSPRIHTPGGGNRTPLKRRASGFDFEQPEKIEKRTRSSTHQNGAAPSTANGDDVRLGPLAERLVQALIEEQQHGGGACNGGGAFKGEMNGASNKSLVKSLNMGNIAALERRIRKELEAQGILDDDDGDSDAEGASGKDEDEVTAELRVRQRELRELSDRNRNALHALCEKARKRIHQQRLAEQLNAIDREVVQLYNKFYSIVPRRKPNGKKERDLLADALHRRAVAARAVDAAAR